jgi:hypothetical protein
VDFREHGTKHLGSIYSVEFLDELSNCQVFKENLHHGVLYCYSLVLSGSL